MHFCERPITDSPDDQLLLQIQGAIAEYERVKILEHTRRGRLHQARMGELGPAKPPYGYRYAPKKHGGDGRIAVRDAEAAMVRQVTARTRCRNERLRVAGVKQAVWTAVRDLLLDGPAVAKELGAWAERNSITSPDLDPQLQRARLRLQELTSQRERLTDAYQVGALSLDVFRVRLKALEENHQAAEIALAQLQTRRLQAEAVRGQALGAEMMVVTHQRLEIHLAIPVSGNWDLTFGETAVGHPAQEDKALNVPLHEGFLPLGGKGHHEGHAAVAQAQGKDLRQQFQAVDDDRRLAPVALGVAAGWELQGHKGLSTIEALRVALAAGLRGECLEARSDSLSLINQLRGDHRIRSPRLESLVEATRALAGRFLDHAFTWVPRADNREAHRLGRRDASLSLDEMIWRAVFGDWYHGYPRQSMVS